MRLLPHDAHRGDAAAAAGHVTVNGAPAKPATKVQTADGSKPASARRDRIVEVVQPIDKRVGAAVAAECLIDQLARRCRPVREPRTFDRERGRRSSDQRDRRRLDRLAGS